MFCLEKRVSVHRGPTKCFQMIHDRAVAPTGIHIELGLLGSAQVPTRIRMPQSHRQAAFPVRALAFQLSIVARITKAIADSVTGDFLLSRQNTFDVVRMQVPARTHVRQPNGIAALDRTGQLTGRFLWIFRRSLRVVGRSDQPKCVLAGRVLDKGH
jgi:hypothetical protein